MRRRFSRRAFLGQVADGAAMLSLSNGMGHAVHSRDRHDPKKAMEGTIQEISSMLPPLMERESVPGVSIALIHEGRVAWQRGFGVRSVTDSQPVSTQTIFEAASLSKPVFAYGVLKLCEAGKLDLDTPLTTYLPEPYLPDEPRLKLITARRVLSHTSGFPNWRPKGQPLVIRTTPGEKFGYSGEGYVYLQTVVEHLTARPLGEHMRDCVLQPLGMGSSSYTWLDGYEQLAAQGHGRTGNPLPKDKPSRANVAWSLHTTPAELAGFVAALLHPPHADQFHLRTRSVQEMLTPQVRVNEVLSWGLGWGLDESSGQKSLWHWGDNGAFKCFAVASRRERNGAVIMTNGVNGLHICQKVVRTVMGSEHPYFAGPLPGL
jgi:CubicO group peptidase (beta-lactamase class C family)